MKLKLWNHLSTLDHYVVFLLDLDYSSWPRVKRLSQESRTGTRNTGPIVNSSETLSFDPSSPVSNRVVQCGGAALAVPSHSHCPRITSSWGARIQPPPLSLPIGPRLLLGVLRVRRIVSSRGVIPNLNKLHFIARCVAICRLLDGRFLMI